MRPLFVSSILGLILLLGAGHAAEIHFDQAGIEIDAGTVGKFTIEYPSLVDASSQPVHKLEEKRAAGQAMSLLYEGGAQIDLAAGEGGKVSLKLSKIPADVKSIAFDMHIPIAFSQGGKWKAGEKEGDFPKSKPANPHFYQGHDTTLQITNYDGASLVLKMPEFSFVQLTDNREWSWDIYNFRSNTPVLADHPELTIAISSVAAAGGAKTAPLVDELGQSAREDWPGKVKNLDELKADVEAEKAYYTNLHPPELDPYGGLPRSKETLGLQATGFFHVEKKGERCFLVDPAGNAFFHLGLCGVNPSDDYTLIKGRDSAYAWVPPAGGEFDSAYKPDANGSTVSFHLANLIRKYGEPYSAESYAARMIARMRKWGFNSYGAFSLGGDQARAAAKFPAVASLPLHEWEGVPLLPQIEETFDPFDEKTRAQIEANFAKALPARATDPLLIGYFIANEPIYENIQHIVPTLKNEHACKRRLVQTLKDKYQTVAAFNTAWALSAKSFDELGDIVLPVETPAAKADVQAFTGLFLEELFRFVTDTYHRYDKTHLLIGNRLQPGTINNEQLCRICGKYLDVMSFNYYTYGFDKDFLRRIYEWTGGRPMMLSEFFWGASKASGLSGGRELNTQQERGLAYRNYVEQGAALGFVVGIEWFTLIDQSVTGRWFQGLNGERANTGIIAVTDRPWKDMLNEVTKTNYGIYQVELGERPPFVFDDPRFKVKP